MRAGAALYCAIAATRPQTRLACGLAAAVACATALLYARAGRFGFVEFDDNRYVYDNVRVRAGLTWDNVAWAFRTLDFSNWHPLTWLSYMLDVQVFGVAPGAHHLVNVALHAVNAALLLLVLWRMTGAPWRSALVAALFALHPLHVESVAWISERKDVLGTLFGLLALGAYAGYVAGRSAARYALVVVLFALSLMAKPMWVTFPFLLLLLDAWPLRRLDRAAVVEKLPLLALSLASSVVTVLAQEAGGAIAGLHVGFGTRLANAAVSYAAYLGKTFWPARLAVFYPLPPAIPGWHVAGAVVLLAGVTALAVATFRRAPWFAVGWLWFLGTLVPVIGLVQVGGQAMADRYTYLPLVGIFVALAWGGHALLGAGWRARGAAAAVLVVLAVVTSRQLDHWVDHESLFRHAIAVTSDNARAHAVLATGLLHQGRLAEAEAEAREALRIEPSSARHRLVLAMVHLDQRRLDDAREELSEAVRLDPGLALAWSFLAEVEDRRGDRQAAIGALQQLVALTPDDPQAWNRLGAVYAQVFQGGAAAAAYQQATRVSPTYTPAWRNLGVLLAASGQPAAGAEALRTALRLAPDDADVLHRLALADAACGQLDEALELARRLDAIDPGRAADVRRRIPAPR